MSTDLVDGLALALDTTERVIAGIGDEQWQNPTPCTDWTVHGVVSHVVAGNRLYSAVLRGEQPPNGLRPSVAELVAAYRDSGAQVLAAFRRPEVFEQTVTLPFGTVPGIVGLHLRITDVLVHGWDLAQATGQSVDFSEQLAAQELEFSRRALADVPADRSPFAPPQPVADDAPAIDRLAACLGRPVRSSTPPA